MVDEDEANAVDKKLNESSVLQDAVMVMVMVIVVEAIMKLTLVMQMMVDKEVDVKLDWGWRGGGLRGVPGSDHGSSKYVKTFLIENSINPL